MMTGQTCKVCGHIVPVPCKDRDDAEECPNNPGDDDDQGD